MYGTSKAGGINGFGGQGKYGGGGGGFLGNGSGDSGTFGKSYQNGAQGGDKYRFGGFGGGGGVYGADPDGGGGGGYSGGGGCGYWASGSGPGGSGGSFNAGTNQTNLSGLGGGHGLVRIYRAENISPTMPAIAISNETFQPGGIIGKLIYELGPNYRLATPEEVTRAREAATPGGVNNWTATNQVKPRNLPGKVNEYGFDVSTTSGFWVIKE